MFMDYLDSENEELQLAPYLSGISEVESGNDEEARHRLLTSGIHAGDRAIGQYGIMPKTAQEMATRMTREGAASEEIKQLPKMSSQQVYDLLQNNPDLAEEIADRLATHVSRDTSDPRIAAYRHRMGHNIPLKDITEEKIQQLNQSDKGYIDRFMKRYQKEKESPESLDEDGIQTEKQSPQSSLINKSKMLGDLSNRFGSDAVLAGLSRIGDFLIPSALADEMNQKPPSKLDYKNTKQEVESLFGPTSSDSRDIANLMAPVDKKEEKQSEDQLNKEIEAGKQQLQTEEKEEDIEAEEPSKTDLYSAMASQGRAEAGYASQLLAAQKSADLQKLFADISEAAAKGSAGIAGAAGKGIVKAPEVDTALFKRFRESADEATEIVKKKIEIDKFDPSSSVSQASRELLEATTGTKVPSNLSLNTIEKLSPTVAKMAAAKESAKLKLEIQKQIKERQEINKANQQSITLSKQLATGTGPVTTRLMNNAISVNNIFATAAQKGAKAIKPDMTAEDVDRLDPKKLNELERIRVVELAIETVRLLSGGGSPAAAIIKKTIPSNLPMDASGAKDYLNTQGKLHPAGQGEFVKMILKLAVRAKEVANEELKKIRQNLLLGGELVKKHRPETWANWKETYGLEDPFEKEKAPSAPTKEIKGSISKKEFDEYVAQNKTTPEKAKKFLENQNIYVEE